MWIALIHSIHFDLDFCLKLRAFLVAQMVKNLPAVWETQVWSLGWEDHLETGMATHSSVLAWRIPWTEEPGRLPGCRESDTTWATLTSVTHWNLSSSLSVSSGLWLHLSSWEGLCALGGCPWQPPFPQPSSTISFWVGGLPSACALFQLQIANYFLLWILFEFHTYWTWNFWETTRAWSCQLLLKSFFWL